MPGFSGGGHSRAARNSGILSDAELRAKVQLTALFHGMGFDAVRIQQALGSRLCLLWPQVYPDERISGFGSGDLRWLGRDTVQELANPAGCRRGLWIRRDNVPDSHWLLSGSLVDGLHADACGEPETREIQADGLEPKAREPLPPAGADS